VKKPRKIFNPHMIIKKLLALVYLDTQVATKIKILALVSQDTKVKMKG